MQPGHFCFCSSRRNIVSGAKASFMILLHHFTWQQFGIVAIVLAIIWYGVIWLVYYRKSPQASAPKPLGHYWETAEEQQGDYEELMGRQSQIEGVSIVPADGFHFAGTAQDNLRGLIPDALEEIKSIVNTVETNGGDKSDFISLFKLISAKYDRLKSSPQLGAVNEWITDNVPFNFSNEELTALWN